jgi:outer membrane protein assembly factor BamB
MRASLLAVALLCFARLSFAADEWPQFRGPDGQGHAANHGVPLTWSESQNIVWKTPLRGAGYSSPAVGRGLAWTTSALDDGKSLWVTAVDVTSGRIVHEREVLKTSQPPHINSKNSHASPSPVLDGDLLFVHFGSSGTAALSTATGKTVWSRQDLKLDHQEGPGSSPIVWNNLLIVHCDGIDVQYIIALDKLTGKTVWKTDRSGDVPPQADQRKAFCTPLVIDVAGKPLLISLAAKRGFAYDPATGKEQWVVQYAPGWSEVPRPIFGHGLLYICTGYMKPELWAIRPEGSGDITATNVVWKVTKNVPANPSPLLVGDEIYMVSDAGIISCVEASSGKVLWTKRVGDNYWASPLLADGRIYFWSEGGETIVAEPGSAFKELARNKLDDGIMATPAVVGSAFLIRTRTHLYRVEQGKAPASGVSQAN